MLWDIVMRRRLLARPAWGGCLAAAMAVIMPGTPALASAAPDRRVAEVVVDASTGSVLYEQQADALRRPASLTKMMTLYLAFDALADGALSLDDLVPFSRAAARQPASRLGIAAGRSLSVRTALRLIAVHSANDVAFALAEKIAGSEARFAALMNARARQLGMTHTHFANATGLTNTGNVTTARDMATLSVAILRHYPRQYALFATRAVQWESRHFVNHNHLLGHVAGVDGIKTGYTVDAGYNIAASASRHGKRVVAVVLDERSVAARDRRAARLIELAFGSPVQKRAPMPDRRRHEHQPLEETLPSWITGGG